MSKLTAQEMAARVKMSEWLYRLREKAGISLEKLGEELGVSFGHLSKLESLKDPRIPSVELGAKLAGFFGVSEDIMQRNILAARNPGQAHLLVSETTISRGDYEHEQDELPGPVLAVVVPGVPRGDGHHP